MDLDGALLPNSMSPVNGLLLNVRVPEGVKNDNLGSHCKIQARISRFQRDKHDFAIRIVGELDDGVVPSFRSHATIVASVSPFLSRDWDFEQVKQCGELAK